MWEHLWKWEVGRDQRNFDNDRISLNYVKHTLDNNMVKENTTSKDSEREKIYVIENLGEEEIGTQ